MQDYSQFNSDSPIYVAIGADDFTCSNYENGEGSWPSVSFMGIGPWWLTINMAPGLCGNTTGIDTYSDWDFAAAKPFWNVFEHGGDGTSLGSCWDRSDFGLNCAVQSCPVGASPDTGLCELAAQHYYCYTALCGIPDI